jgi:SAM-dependent methyltransferase
MIIDFGCGRSKVPGAIGVDNVVLPDVNVVHDLLSFPYPFSSNCADEIYLNHVVEHFDLEHILLILKEVYRILKPGGMLCIRVPHVFSVAAWEDPTHKKFFTFNSFHFFDIQAVKSYYKSIDNLWILEGTTSRVTLFNWKRYRLRKLDTFMSQLLANYLNWLLGLETFPGTADLFVKLIPIYFVEIRWDIHKPVGQSE